MKSVARKCPAHGVELVGKLTGYGMRYACTADGCTVVCWDGDTSTPADQETRELRYACHKAFDPLWKTKSVFESRRDAYKWLRSFMRVSSVEGHIGMFDKFQCGKLLAELKGKVTA